MSVDCDYVRHFSNSPNASCHFVKTNADCQDVGGFINYIDVSKSPHTQGLLKVGGCAGRGVLARAVASALPPNVNQNLKNLVPALRATVPYV